MSHCFSTVARASIPLSLLSTPTKLSSFQPLTSLKRYFSNFSTPRHTTSHLIISTPHHSTPTKPHRTILHQPSHTTPHHTTQHHTTPHHTTPHHTTPHHTTPHHTTPHHTTPHHTTPHHTTAASSLRTTASAYRWRCGTGTGPPETTSWDRCRSEWLRWLWWL